MKKLFSLTFIIVIIAGLSSCEKGFLNVNTNPNQPTNVSPGLVLSNDLYQMASQQADGLSQCLGMWMAHWSRSGNYIPDVATETYTISPGYSYSENFWSSQYHTNLDLSTVEQESKAANDPFMEGVAKVLMAYNYEELVDVYNDIPYSQALDVNNIHPKYDPADTIYTELFAQIDSGIALIQESATAASADASYDIMYGGNQNSWLQFANTLELKMLINLSQDPAETSFIPAQIAKIKSEDNAGFIGAGGGAMVNPGYINSTGKQSPFYGFFGFTPTGTPAGQYPYFRANTFAVLFSMNTNDPRITYFFAPTVSLSTGADTVSGNYEGNAAISNGNTSAFGTGTLGTATSSTPILPDFESLFLQAEAALRGWIPGSARQFYDEAITQSFVYEGVPNAVAAAQTYYSQPNVQLPGNLASALPILIGQKWASLNGVDELETWNDYRRLGMPDIPLTTNPNRTATQIPVRMLYPQTELDRNASNVPAAGKGNNAQFTGKIFWMP